MVPGSESCSVVSQSRYGDYFGLPTVGQVGAGKDVSHSALPLRAYNLIYNEWFRDQNLCVSLLTPTDNGPDFHDTYHVRWRGKRHDYLRLAFLGHKKAQRLRCLLVLRRM